MSFEKLLLLSQGGFLGGFLDTMEKLGSGVVLMVASLYLLKVLSQLFAPQPLLGRMRHRCSDRISATVAALGGCRVCV